MTPFAHPAGAVLLAAFPLLVLGAALARWRRASRTAPWGGLANLRRLSLLPPGEWDTVRSSVLWLALGLTFLTFARPQWGEVAENVRKVGLDVAIVLDVSRSMAVPDVAPNRLERARMEVRSFLSSNEGDRMGLVAFGGVPLALSPITEDAAAVALLLDIADTQLIPPQGTDVGRALLAAQKLFPAQRDRDAVVLLLSDGEDMGADAADAARSLARSGIRLFCIGVGTPSGGPVPGPRGEPLMDPATGRAALSRLNEAELRQMAALADGRYWSLGSGGSAVPSLLEELGRLKRREYASKSRATRQEQFRWFAAPALLFLFAALLLPGRRRLPREGAAPARRSHAPLAPGAGLVLGAALLACAGQVWARSPRSSAAEALAAYRAGSADRALVLYRQALAASDDPAEKALLNFNLGTCLLAKKDPHRAVDALTLALVTDEPEVKIPTLYNLALALYDSGSPDRALASLRGLLTLEPGHQAAKLLYEWILRNRPEEPPPPDEPPEPPPPHAKPPDLLEQLPMPPPKDMQDQIRPPEDPPPGMKPW
ncbi:MAG: VWA domain-containing protein [Acidobacteriota bacterium]